jgi:hypothetical protein
MIGNDDLARMFVGASFITTRPGPVKHYPNGTETKDRDCSCSSTTEDCLVTDPSSVNRLNFGKRRWNDDI